VRRALGLETGLLLRYADPTTGIARTVRLIGRGDAARLDALLLAGPPDSAGWLLPWWASAAPIGDHARALLLPDPQPPGPAAPRVADREVCNCVGVTESAITRALAALRGDDPSRFEALKSTLRCGTQCGSCQPELRRLVARVVARAIDPEVRA
jgi:assimilatory nitrate reductase catalytic subunit